MILTTPMPFEQAREAISRQTPVGSVLTSAEWRDVPQGIRDEAFFSAQQTNLTFLEAAKKEVESLVDGDGDRAASRLRLRELAQGLGIATGDDSLTDISSDRRLALILDTKVAQAQGKGRWQLWQDPTLRDEYPAWELIDTNPGYEGTGRRDWPARWLAGGGTFYGRRMIALKSDPVWRNLGPFRNPYPPFDYNSYWDVLEIDRDEAEALGVIARGEATEPTEGAFNADLKASLPEGGSAFARLLQDTFGNLFEIADGALKWTGKGRAPGGAA